MALMGLMALGASAQMLTSRTYTKTKRPTTWYVRAGASFNNVAGMSDAEYSEDGDELSLGTKTGFVADFGFQKPIGKSGLYWGMELGLGNRGYSVNIKEDDIESKLSLLTWNLTYSPVTIATNIPSPTISKSTPTSESSQATISPTICRPRQVARNTT